MSLTPFESCLDVVFAYIRCEGKENLGHIEVLFLADKETLSYIAIYLLGKATMAFKLYSLIPPRLHCFIEGLDAVGMRILAPSIQLSVKSSTTMVVTLVRPFVASVAYRHSLWVIEASSVPSVQNITKRSLSKSVRHHRIRHSEHRFLSFQERERHHQSRDIGGWVVGMAAGLGGVGSALLMSQM